MKINFGMIADRAVRVKLESLDFDLEIAEKLAYELVELFASDIDFASVWIDFIYDTDDGNKVVDYDITALPARASKPGNA